MSRRNNIINAFFKDWMYAYPWISEFFLTRNGNIDNLRAWMKKQSSEKAYLGLRNSLVTTLSTMHFYFSAQKEKMSLKELAMPDISIKPDWESLRQYNITTVWDLMPYMMPAIEVLDMMWANGFLYHAINHRNLFDFLQ